ncbi:MAG TPA: hypothetical protein ENN06_09365 [Desulfobacteraceae bacterium]|nr:hypothetical protein [Desulfobacteraceae bacterium]
MGKTLQLVLVHLMMAALLLGGSGGCARMAVNSFMEPTVANLQRQTDLDLVCEGASSFLLMLDSMIAGEPMDKRLLLTAVQGFSAYASALDVCGKPERAATVSSKAREYALALLATKPGLRSIAAMDPDDLQSVLAELNEEDAALLFWAGNGWATWIHFQDGSPASLADLVRVEQIMLRVVELDEAFYHGGAHLFLGAFYGAKPPLLGGKPNLSRFHFEKALALSRGEFLPVQVVYARTYARMMYDRDLYERLLGQVVDFPAEQRPDIALANEAAKRRAARLLEEIDRVF